jgi:uncharacterized protein (TIGR02646 family)
LGRDVDRRYWYIFAREQAMIYVSRFAVPKPEIFHTEAALEQEKARAFFSSAGNRQSRFDFRIYRARVVKQALTELFHGKCAYCESRFESTSFGDIEFFRPRSGVTERPDHPGYWWLASSWENLLIVCAECNRVRAIEGHRSGKGSRFPVEEEAHRAMRPEDDLRREQPLLLDPCNDNPEEHLVFSDTGIVSSATPRGQTSIAVLGLNRMLLVAARRRAVQQVDEHFEILEKTFEINSVNSEQSVRELIERTVAHLRDLTAAHQEYAAIKRQFIKYKLAMLNQRMARSGGGSLDLETDAIAATPTVTPTIRDNARKSFAAFEQSQSTFSLQDMQGRAKFLSQRREIEEVAITHFKGISSLRLDLRRSSGGWLMLLGENGAGKTSVLQAIALTLAGPSYLAWLVSRSTFDPQQLIQSGRQRARIAIKTSGFSEPHELTISRKEGVVLQTPGADTLHIQAGSNTDATVRRPEREAGQFIILAYGATRLLPRGAARRYGTDYARVDNLFDPFLPLFDAEQWLEQLGRVQFSRVALVFKDLLALDKHAKLVRIRGKVYVNFQGKRALLSQLSDGYQSVVALCVDILEVVMRLWPRLQDAEGIVLIDELGAHLHPTWKMQVVTSLRRAFPGIQFFATTHDPLCLRGLGAGEVVVMERDINGAIVAVTDLPSPADFRVDQLLTSEFFGLSSTIDPETERVFDDYYALLALKDRSAEQQARLTLLRGELAQRRYLGNTPREQLMYEAVDELIARNRIGERKRIPELKTAAREAIERIWNSGTQEPF